MASSNNLIESITTTGEKLVISPSKLYKKSPSFSFIFSPRQEGGPKKSKHFFTTSKQFFNTSKSNGDMLLALKAQQRGCNLVFVQEQIC